MPRNKLTPWKRKLTKKLFAKVDCLFGNILSCSLITLPKSQTSNWTEEKLDCCCRNLFLNCIEKMQTLRTFSKFYLTLQEYLQLWFWIKIPKAKTGDAGSPSKAERQKFHRLHTRGAAACASVLNLSIFLPVSEVRKIIETTTSYTKIELATKKFERMNDFVRFRDEICCMDLAFVEKLAKVILVWSNH